MIQYAIKDIERITGIKAHTLRIWEKRYGILDPKRTDTNIRYYDGDDLKKVLNISILRQHGTKISKIVAMSPEEIIQKVLEITLSDTNQNTLVESLMICMLEMDETRFEKVLANCIIRFGFRDTILKVVYPFFVRVGVLWQVGTINPGQEHFISNLIRQKLIVAIDHQGIETKMGGKRFLLFLPEGELHELGILFYNYLIRAAGHTSIYLGQSIPLEDASSINDQYPADYIVTSIHNTKSRNEFEEITREILKTFPKTKLILTNRTDFAPQVDNSKRLLMNLSVEAFDKLLEK